MPHRIKQGDTPTLEWSFEADISDVDEVWIAAGNPMEGEVLFRREATIVTPATGLVSLTLTETETSVPGSYLVEGVTVKGGVITTYPSDGYETLVIYAGIE